MSIDGTLKLITDSTSGISVGDTIAIVVAIVSLVGVVLSTILTNRTTKKISNSNAELQEKWNQKILMLRLSPMHELNGFKMLGTQPPNLLLCILKP